MFKKVKKNHRWRPIFNKPTAYAGSEKSSWDYIIDCFLNDYDIPTYFYPHKITAGNDTKKQINRRLPDDLHNIEIQLMDLHFDGHNGDHLLIYSKIAETKTVYLIAIGTHSDLF